jgi:undecaprenol kinase
MKLVLRRLSRSFDYAFQGLYRVYATQPNTRYHLLAAFAVSLLAVLLRLEALIIAVLVAMIGFVWAMECMNTAIEKTVDLITLETKPLAKLCKDAAAAAVLIAAISSVVVGLLNLGPPMLEYFRGIFSLEQ